MIRFLLAAALSAAAAVPAFAAPVVTYPDNVVSWNVGSGQSNGNFTVVRDGGLEIGLRVQERGVGPYAPVGAGGFANAMYVTATGNDPTNPNRAKWNFDFSISAAAGISNLDAISFTFEELTPGLTPLTDYPNILASPAAFAAFVDPSTASATLAQNSLNPKFGFLGGAGYNSGQPGIYRITLSVTDEGQTTSNSILVNIGNVPLSAVPEPTTLAVFGALGLVAAGTRLRRKPAAVA